MKRGLLGVTKSKQKRREKINSFVIYIYFLNQIRFDLNNLQADVTFMVIYIC